MKRVTGIGGIFFKSDDPDKLISWYNEHLGLAPQGDGSTSVIFPWKRADDGGPAMTVWSLFPRDTKYFNPGAASFMINYRVDDLDAVLDKLREEGVEIDPNREDLEYGRFAWIIDPEGNKIELWQPPVEQ
jgi:predicted enzyme related to lactoylglutathione lyase